MHASHHRCHEAFQDPAAHPGTDQVGDAGDCCAGARGGGQEPVQRSAEGSREPEGPAHFGVPRVGGYTQDTGLGQFPGAFGELHPCSARMGRHDVAGDAEFGREVRDGG